MFLSSINLELWIVSLVNFHVQLHLVAPSMQNLLWDEAHNSDLSNIESFIAIEFAVLEK